jgi:integrase/recombinase XerD
MATETLSINIELDRFQNKSGLQKVYLRVTQNRKHSRIKTGVLVSEKQFKRDAKFGEWIKRHPDASLYNDTLSKKFLEAKRVWSEKQNSDEFVNREVVAVALRHGPIAKDFFAYWDKQVEQMPNWRHGQGYTTTKNCHLRPFFDMKGFSEVIDFRHITVPVLYELEAYLRKSRALKNGKIKKGKDDSGVYTQMKRVKAIFNKAVEEKLIDRNIYPFGRGDYKMPPKGSGKRKV